MTIMVQVTISSLAAYSLSKLKPKGHNYVLLFFVGTLMISEQTLLFPTYIMMYDFPLIHVNLINSFIAPVLAWSAWGWAIFLFKGFFDSVPNELMESARIDGANNLYIFGKIILPLSKPVFAVIILNTFMAVYNTFVVPLLLLPEENNWTLMVRIYAAQEGRATWNEVIIMLTFATIPVLIIYMFAQKYIVQGINMTGIKG
ncbi:MAG: carbohydrate ABC transporter permease [Clostridiaceae bacterium]